LTLIDVTNVPGVETDDEVTFMGREGDLSISAEEIAKTAATLSYEVTCGVSERVPRRYLSNG
jgi:alanine racemase